MEITETLKNGNIINITPILGEVVVKIKNQGTDDEFKSFSFSGYTKINKQTKIGTMSVSAPVSTKRFSKSPSIKPKLVNRQLDLGSSLKTKLISTTKDSNNNITSYLYDLIYVGKEKVSKAKTLKYQITGSTVDIKTKSTGITRIICGNYIVSNSGERRKITIQGSPGAEFEIAINKLIDIKDSLGRILDTSDLSILTSPNSTANLSTQRTFKGNVGVNGTYSFYQKISRNVITTNATSPQRYSIDLKTTCVNSSIFSTKGWETNRNGWEGWYSKQVAQYINPTITLRPTTDISSGATISVNGGTAVNFRASDLTSYDLKYKGYYKRDKGNVDKYYSVSYVMVAASGNWVTKGTSAGGAVSFNSIGPDDLGNAITTNNTLGTPVFSNTNQSESDWTYSTPNNNDGTVVDIRNIVVAGVGTNTFTLTFDFAIEEWGRKDITMSLATNYIVYNA